MTVTIIVITYNSTHVIPRFISGLNLAGRMFNLLVIDNDSKSKEQIKGMFADAVIPDMYNIKYIQNSKNVMYTKAVNQGFEATFGSDALLPSDFVVIMNPDCYGIEPGWLVKMLSLYDTYTPDIAGFKLVREDMTIEHVGAHHPGVHEGKGEVDTGQYDEARELTGEQQYVTGACWLVPRVTVRRFGKLDEKYIHYQSDREYCFHVRRNGGKVWYLPVRMVHLFGKSSSA